MEQKSNAYLESAPVGSLMRKYAIPCVISLLVAALYNIVDQIFIANASYLGSYGNAANTVVFPLTIVALAIAVMIGDGCCAFVSIALGAGRKEEAHKSVGSAVLLCLVSSVILTAVYLLFAKQILVAFGGSVNEETFACAKEYFFWISVGIPFYMFGQAMNPIIRSDGSPKFAMVSTVSGAVVNIILDPVFIFPLHMGMKGAAIATVLGQILTAVLAVWYLTRMKAIKLQKNSFGFYPNLMKRYLPLGITSFLSQISLVFAMAAVNNMLQKYGALDEIYGQAQYAQIPMAVVGIVMKFFQIVISIAVGMAAGCIPIVGYNIGAGRKDRAKDLFRLLLICEAAVGAVALLIVELFPKQLISIFGAGNESSYYTAFAVKSFRIYLCMMVLATVNKGTFIYLQSLGKALASTLISMIREIVFGVGFALLLPLMFGLDGVLYSMPVSDILTFIIAAVVIWKTFGELSKNGEEAETQQVDAVRKADAAPLTDTIVTIGRSYGAGGRTIGRKIAEKLNVPYYDSELLQIAAEESGLNLKFLQNTDEKPSASNALYLSIGFGTSEYNAIAHQAEAAQREIIERVAAAGPCVIVGRCADLILEEKKKIFRVFITGSQEERIKRIHEREGLSAEEAKQKINRVDKERAAYYNQRGKGRWAGADNYDLILNTDWYSQEESADLVCYCLRIKSAGK